MNYRDLNAPELVKQWKKIVNPHIQMGRDSHFMKDLLNKASSVQILLGIYQHNGSNITIPQFVRQINDWLETDEQWAEILLSVYLAGGAPKEYNTYLDNYDVQSAVAHLRAKAAYEKLREFANEVLA